MNHLQRKQNHEADYAVYLRYAKRRKRGGRTVAWSIDGDRSSGGGGVLAMGTLLH